MKRQFEINLFISLTFFLMSCSHNDSIQKKESENLIKQNKNDSIAKQKKADSISLIDFPPVKKLEEFKRTEFVSAIESNMSKDKNSIYCVTLLYAWNNIKKYIKDPSVDFDNLNKSESCLNVLDSNDYKVNVKINGDTIEAKVHFSKSLPFLFQLTNFSGKNNFKFGGKKVSSFGVQGYDILGSEILKIAYYKDDDNFIIKLQTYVKDNEILLFKTNKDFNTMKDYIIDLNKKIEIGKKEMKINQTDWRYKITNEDFVYIPIIKFNIETNYTNKISELNSKNSNVKILKAWQRNAFILNENGASILGEVDLVGVASAEPEEKMPKPKHMKFDKPFFIMLKKTDSEYPYFAVRILNNELMILE